MYKFKRRIIDHLSLLISLTRRQSTMMVAKRRRKPPDGEGERHGQGKEIPAGTVEKPVLCPELIMIMNNRYTS